MSGIYLLLQIITMLLYLFIMDSRSELQAIEKIFSKCKKKSPQFDGCMKQGLNDVRRYFKQGIPEIGVAPFDPHFAKELQLTRTLLGLDFTLILRNVYEHGWTNSTVTKFKTDWVNASIVYSQYFPVKYLEGLYEFKSLSFGARRARTGRWNITLRDYAQSTRVARGANADASAGASANLGVVVRVEIERIGDMDLHVTNLLTGTNALEFLLDRAINTFWMPGFILVRSVINDLVSTAFTDIWSKSFKKFQIQNFIKD